MLRIPKAAILALSAPLVTGSVQGSTLFSNLATFHGTNGTNPYGQLVQGADGSFYGTTYQGGAYMDRNGYSLGTIFKLSPDGTLTTLLLFDGTNGAAPDSGFLLANDGTLYGTTLYGGTDTSVNDAGRIGDGTIFKISTNGAFTSLYSFDSSTLAYTNGAFPHALIQGNDGDFYGTTGGGLVPGTIFKITSSGALTTLATFAGTNGSYPEGALTQNIDGSFYGVTYQGGAHNSGTVFKVSSTGVLTTLVSFDGTNGARPFGGLTRGLDGCLYGTTQSGGTNNSGTVFRVKPDGTFETIASFGPLTGVYPYAKLLLGADHNFYGRTSFGSSATSFAPTLFKVTPSGAITVLYVLNGESNDTAGGMIQGLDGALYGTEVYGTNFYGTVFRLSIPMEPIIRTQTSNNSLHLTWNSVAGQRYQVQDNSTLDPNSWNDLGLATAATSRFMSASESIDTDLQQFYRVVVLP